VNATANEAAARAPWHIDPHNYHGRRAVHDSCGFTVAMVELDASGRSAAVDDNAALIAAAPDLLSALESLTQAVYDNRQWLSGPAYQRVVAWADRAIAAIDKAKGAS
jgi:hypothetical protein